MIDLKELKKAWGIGLTGGIACGKSTVANILRSKNILVLDADGLARDAVRPQTQGYLLVVEHFGEEILNKDQTIDRKKIADLIFAKPEEKLWLEQALHPLIRGLLARRLEDEKLFSEPKLWFYEAPLIFESGIASEFRQIWTVVCPRDVQVRRIKVRDGRADELIEAIITSQMPQSEKAAMADVVIDTNCSLVDLTRLVKERLDAVLA